MNPLTATFMTLALLAAPSALGSGPIEVVEWLEKVGDDQYGSAANTGKGLRCPMKAPGIWSLRQRARREELVEFARLLLLGVADRQHR